MIFLIKLKRCGEKISYCVSTVRYLEIQISRDLIALINTLDSFDDDDAQKHKVLYTWEINNN